ncbi:MAG: ATP-binding protein [Eggerthellaceae bacterium]|nr:ATP-binding protein [Eggerthellaceae bacterium]
MALGSARNRGMRSLSSKIFRTVLAFTLAVIVVMSLVLTGIYYFSAERDGEARLMAQARDAAAYLNDSPSDSNVEVMKDQFAGLVRFTLIDAEGNVLYDSSTPDPSALENHGDRPEIAAAEQAGTGAVTRFSDTLRTDTVYAAVLLDDGSIVRLAETRESLLSFAGSLVAPIAASLAAAVLLVLLLSRALTRRIMKPIDALDFSRPLDNDIYEEMNPLLVRIDEQQRQLKAQNEELARAESMRRDFSANVSHEMKTPLQVISGYAELMRGGLVPPEDTPKFAGLIYDESQAMRSLINDVLTLSRLDETAFEGDAAVPVDVLTVAERMASRLEALAGERAVVVSVGGVHAFMLGSETLVEEMLYNLIENGIRYNHAGGSVEVSVSEEEAAHPFAHADRGLSPQQASQMLHGQASAQAVAASQRQVVVRARDTGPGIPSDKHEKIFERFYRMEKSRSKETGGTGLGLAIVKHAVLYHNGTIEVQSEVGKGTTFVLRFPAASSR